MKTETTRLLSWVAALSLFAGLVHGLLTEDHFREW